MKYVKCPKCELNYIQENESYCNLCDPKMQGKSITDAELEYEVRLQLRREADELYKKSWKQQCLPSTLRRI